MMFNPLKNVFNKAHKSALEEKKVDMTSPNVQQLVGFLMTNPDINTVIDIHDPSSALMGGRQKGRPNKKTLESFDITDKNVQQRSHIRRAYI
jgi:hypothetical protein